LNKGQFIQPFFLFKLMSFF